MTNNKAYKWIFPSRFRANAYSWKASRLACQRLRKAVSEIKKVAKKEPELGGEGAVRLIEKLWPALSIWTAPNPSNYFLDFDGSSPLHFLKPSYQADLYFRSVYSA